MMWVRFNISNVFIAYIAKTTSAFAFNTVTTFKFIDTLFTSRTFFEFNSLPQQICHYFWCFACFCFLLMLYLSTFSAVCSHAAVTIKVLYILSLFKNIITVFAAIILFLIQSHILLKAE